MHPPLDRPHPDCQEAIQALYECHNDNWKKYTGGCNDIKVSLDQCLKYEKKRLLDEMNKDLPEQRNQLEEVIKKAFGKQMTFQEYLKQDKEYQAELVKKNKGSEQ